MSGTERLSVEPVWPLVHLLHPCTHPCALTMFPISTDNSLEASGTEAFQHWQRSEDLMAGSSGQALSNSLSSKIGMMAVMARAADVSCPTQLWMRQSSFP